MTSGLPIACPSDFPTMPAWQPARGTAPATPRRSVKISAGQVRDRAQVDSASAACVRATSCKMLRLLLQCMRARGSVPDVAMTSRLSHALHRPKLSSCSFSWLFFDVSPELHLLRGHLCHGRHLHGHNLQVQRQHLSGGKNAFSRFSGQ